MRGKKLQRLIKRSFGSDSFESELAEFIESLKANRIPEDSSHCIDRLTQITQFLDAVENSFNQSESMLDLANRSLEVSTQELFQANERFRVMNKAITSMVNSLDEGFLVIDQNGVCGSIVSQAAIAFLGREPVGEHLSKILNIGEDDLETFNEWLQMVFDEIIPFADLVELAPKVLPKPFDPSKQIEIKFKPIRNLENSSVSEVVVILTDVSEKVEAERKLSEQKLFTDMVVKYLNNKTNFVRMIQMTRETSMTMKNWTFSPQSWKDQFSSLGRELHTLKGGLNTLSMYALGYKIHQAEDEVLSFCNETNLEDSNSLIRLLGEEVEDSVNEFLERHKRIFALDKKSISTKEIPTNNIYKFCNQLLKSGMTELLKHYVDDIVAVPFASLFAPIESHTYTLSLSQEKQIDFIVNDPFKIRVIPEFYQDFFEQMVHVFNNMVDHGIETTEERRSLGKPINGRIVIDLTREQKAKASDSLLSLVISDDGRGIDPAIIREKLAEKGLDTANESDESVIRHIFDQGFSTRDVATTTSGRGIGMAAALEAIASMGGTIDVRSILGSGTQFLISIPYVNDLNQEILSQIEKSEKKFPIKQNKVS